MLLPSDYLIAHKTIDGMLETVDTQDFPQDGITLSIGPKTIEQYSAVINNAQTIFFNAAMGFWQIEESLKGTQALLQAIAHAKAYSVVGGGDSVAAINQGGLAKNISHISTGGGASLEFLEGKTLPGVMAISNY